jgi:hypothetical protein
MLRKLDEKQRYCLEQALGFGERARHAPDEESKQFLLKLEQRWLRLSRAYEFYGELEDFLKSHKQIRANNPIIEKLLGEPARDPERTKKQSER